eukprot:TRINITY_DN22491_c0_g1_i1.p1 TRINITY_DN22491_c0_g1~~TRINITY_DN22491_c0_g1_i1.p1  ORF type:complete len:129 (-),score=11.30 TRINITY_DN22491_c0_g1_i1:32-418(-)
MSMSSKLEDDSNEVKLLHYKSSFPAAAIDLSGEKRNYLSTHDFMLLSHPREDLSIKILSDNIVMIVNYFNNGVVLFYNLETGELNPKLIINAPAIDRKGHLLCYQLTFYGYSTPVSYTHLTLPTIYSV